MRNWSLSCVLGATMIATSWASHAQGELIELNPSKDNSIYSESDNSNAAGELYAGTTPNLAVRRALLLFDIAGRVPAGATINSVSLALSQTRIGPGVTASFELRPLTAVWGEGTSSGIGAGGSPTLEDATWNYRLYDTDQWTTPGGDFGPASGTATIGTVIDTLYVFNSQAGLVADVQNWLNEPDSNFGWILRAADESLVTARVFGSRESSLADQPVLTVDFTPVPEPGACVLWGVAAICAAMYQLRRRRCEAVVLKPSS
ncbi:MAG: DNRLRE domain-containing protein [Pirellulaceae bacterium]